MLTDLANQISVLQHPGYIELSGAIAQRLRITAPDMLRRLAPSISQRALDLVAVAAGAYALDRIYRRARSKANEGGIRAFPVCFRVAEPDYWSQATVSNQVAELLNFLTGDLWLLSFAQGSPLPRPRQQAIELSTSWSPSHLSLYSGGLDSAAGLACELLQGQRDFLLLTVSHQTSIRRRSIEQVSALKHWLPNAGSLAHMSFVVNLENPARLPAQETTQRSRGFLFCTAAAVLAATNGIQEVRLYENGHGAINLPLSAGGLTAGFSTRGAHPTALRMIADLASDALGTTVQFRLPFLSMTKAEMVAKLGAIQGLVQWAQLSRSCVHSSWRESGIAHCGQCPACIERHQAFTGADIEDPTIYSAGRLWDQPDPLADDYFRAYLDNALAWTEGDARTRQRLRQHCAITGIKASDRSGLSLLHSRHAREALSVYGHLLDEAQVAA